MVHHSHLAQALFYQLALSKFGGNRVATLGSPIQVQTLMEQSLQMEEECQEKSPTDPPQGDSISLATVNETNSILAKQATACLWDKASMLEEYFGIVFKKQDCAEPDEQEIVLTGLPILLDSHSPPPHGLPLFLLRLATEVHWEEERPCFDGVCRELGYYYAQLSGGGEGQEDSERKAQVQHTLFPALSCLLTPSQKLQDDVKPLTLLSNLYKVFERC